MQTDPTYLQDTAERRNCAPVALIEMDVLVGERWVHAEQFTGTAAQIREDDDPVISAAVDRLEAGEPEVVVEASWATFRLRVS